MCRELSYISILLYFTLCCIHCRLFISTRYCKVFILACSFIYHDKSKVRAICSHRCYTSVYIDVPIFCNVTIVIASFSIDIAIFIFIVTVDFCSLHTSCICTKGCTIPETIDILISNIIKITD